MTKSTDNQALRIAIIGTGNLATTLGATWTRSGQQVGIIGRSPERAATVASAIGGTAIVAAEVPEHDVVVLAIAPDGVAEALSLVGAPEGALDGVPLIDATNAVDWSTGMHLLERGSFAERVASWAPGAKVVKALQSYAGSMWRDAPDPERTVALCGDDPGALELVERAVQALGGRTVVVGGLDAARQAEDATAFMARIAAAGGNPRLTVPDVRLAR